jgi:hypothetical protein
MSATPVMPEPEHDAAAARGGVRLALTREVSCIRSLAWRTDLPIATDWRALGDALAAAGLARRSPVGAMQRFASDAGHEIAAIPATGRIQIRVHYTVPEHDRRFAAERLFQIVVHALLRT